MIDLEQFVFPLLTPSLLQILMSSDDILTLDTSYLMCDIIRFLDILSQGLLKILSLTFLLN